MWVCVCQLRFTYRRTAPKFGTHVRIDTINLKKKLTHPSPGALGGYPSLAMMCGVAMMWDVGCGFVCVSYASLTYFGDLLRCPHKRIVTITKVYIATNNIHVKIVRFREN